MTSGADPGPTDALDQRPGTFLGTLARGSGWIVGGTYAARLIGFLNTLVVAWYLSPEDFGLFAIGLTFMQLIAGFTELGLSLAVVRFRNATDDELDTLFTLSAARGLLLALVMIVAAPVAAAIYGDQRIGVVFAVLAAVPFLTGLVNPRFYEFERAGDFSREFVVTVSAKVASVCLTISLAAATGSYVAILAGPLVAAAVQVTLSYALRPKRPRVTLAAWRRMLGFTGWITIVAIFAALNNKLDAMLFGRFAGASAAGQLYVGSQLAELATRDVSVPLARAIYPGLSARQNDPDAVRESYLQGVEVLAAVALPLAVGFALVAHEAIPLVFQPKWSDAVPVIQLLGPVLGLQTVFAATQALAMATGRLSVIAWREGLFFCVRTPAVVWALLTHGFFGGVLAVAAMGLLHCVLDTLVYARLAADDPARPWRRASRSLLSVGVMTVVVLAATAGLPSSLPAAAKLAVLVGAGGMAYLAAHATLWIAHGRPDGIEAAVAGLARGLRG